MAAAGMRCPPPPLRVGVRIAVIGTGNIGRTLGERWRAAGYDVVFGGRTPAAAGPGGAPVVTVAEAIGDADVVLFAVPGPAVAEVVGNHAAALAGKVVIDAANRMGGPEFDSRAVITAQAPNARYVRAFNTLGWENFADPPAGAALFFAADPDARPVADELITALGLEPVFVGDADATATVDAVLPLWFALVRQSGGNRRLALRVVR